MYTDERIEKNKQDFIELISSLKVECANIKGLIAKLESSDFFTAPATVSNHNSFRGGLCGHLLSVYNNLKMLVATKGLPYTEDDIIIVSLLHEVNKMSYFDIYLKNEKVYDESGDKIDAGGRYYWKQSWKYTVADVQNRFIYGNAGETSEYIARYYIPLTMEQSMAIMYAHGTKEPGTENTACLNVYSRYSLAMLLNIADMMSSFIDEKIGD